MTRLVTRFLVVATVVSAACSSHLTSSPTGGGTSVVPFVFQGGGQPTNFTRFSPSTYSSFYGGIILGPDKNMWFVDVGGPGLVKLTMAGATTEYPLPSAQPFELNPVAISPAPNSKFYILACNADHNQVGEGSLEVMNMKGKGTVYQLPASDVGQGGCSTSSLATGSDGNAWFAGASDIDRITPAGVITQYTLAASFEGITAGPNGDLWFSSGGTAGSIDPNTGTITTYQFQGGGPECCTNPIVAPPDGNLWFVDGHNVLKMTPSGQFTAFPSILPLSGTVMGGTVGPGGFPFFVSDAQGYQPTLLRINTANGNQTGIQSPYGLDNLSAATTGPDGNVWITTTDGHIVVYILKVLRVTPTSLDFPSPQTTATITAKESGHPTLSATSSNTGIASVAPGQQENTFIVEALAVGNCSITVQDSNGNSFDVQVTVQ